MRSVFCFFILCSCGFRGVFPLTYRMVDITNYFMGVWVLDRSEYIDLWQSANIAIDTYWSEDTWTFAGKEYVTDPSFYYELAYDHLFPFGTAHEYLQFNEDFCYAVTDPTVDVIWFTNGYSAGAADNVEEMSYSIMNLHDCIGKNPSALDHRKTFVGYSAIDYILSEIFYFNYGYIVHGNLIKNLWDRGDKTWSLTHDAIEATRLDESFFATYEVIPLTTIAKQEKSYFGKVVAIMFNCASILSYDRNLLDFEETIAFIEFIDDPSTVLDLERFFGDIESGVIKPLVLLIGCIEHFLWSNENFVDLYDQFIDILEEKDIPVFSGVKFGHIDSSCSTENFPIVFGREAELYYDGMSDEVELEVFLDEDVMFEEGSEAVYEFPEKFKNLVADLGVDFDTK